MKTLQINTTNSFSEVSINNEGNIFVNQIKTPYSENIMPAVTGVLSEANLSLNEIDAFGVVTGPGSFTGIRIGMAVLKGIICGLNKPCVSINAFDIIAYNVDENDFVVVLDSGNQDNYYAIYKDKTVQEMGFGTVEAIKNFASKNNLKIYYSFTEKDKFSDEANLNCVTFSNQTFSKIVAEKVQSNQFTPIEKLSPIYIKLSQAEIGLEQNMKEHLSLKDAVATDASSLEVIDKQCFDAFEQYSKLSFENELAEKSKHYFVAKYKDLVIGYVGVQVLGDELNLLKIAVLPQYRMLGVASKLMELTFKLFNDEKLTSYFLEVRESNKSAIKFYQKLGFKTELKRINYYDGKEDALVMFYR